MVINFIGYRLVAKHAMFRLPAHMINAAIDGNAIEPTVELRRLLEVLKTLIGFEEHVLANIKCVVRI